MICKKCGHDNKEGAKYCGHCGICLVEKQLDQEITEKSLIPKKQRKFVLISALVVLVIIAVIGVIAGILHDENPSTQSRNDTGSDIDTEDAVDDDLTAVLGSGVWANTATTDQIIVLDEDSIRFLWGMEWWDYEVQYITHQTLTEEQLEAKYSDLESVLFFPGQTYEYYEIGAQNSDEEIGDDLCLSVYRNGDEMYALLNDNDDPFTQRYVRYDTEEIFVDYSYDDSDEKTDYVRNAEGNVLQEIYSIYSDTSSSSLQTTYSSETDQTILQLTYFSDWLPCFMEIYDRDGEKCWEVVYSTDTIDTTMYSFQSASHFTEDGRVVMYDENGNEQ